MLVQWTGFNSIGPRRECEAQHSDVDVTLSVFILAILFASFIPQHFRIIHKRTSDGISPWFLFLGGISVNSTLFNILILQWKAIQCCKVIGLGPCLESTLRIAQLGVQFLMLNIVLALFVLYFPPHKKVSAVINSSWRLMTLLPSRTMEWSLTLLVIKIVVGHFILCTVITSLLLAFAGGPENGWTLAWAGFLGVMGVVLATLQYLPQIILTFVRKSAGALSIPMMMIQTPGAALLAISLARGPDANWSAWIVFAATAFLQGFLLIICIIFYFKERALARANLGDHETMPLLAEDPSTVPSTVIPAPSDPASLVVA